MKKFLALALALAALTACGTKETDWNEVYGGMISAFQDIILNATEIDTEVEGGTGVAEAAVYGQDGYALENIGYAIQDVSGDGIPEFIVADKDGSILALYTFKDGAPVCTIEGWSRNRWNWLGEGRFLNEGSNGAMNSITGEYRISEDGSEKEVINCWFTDAKNENFEIGYYHNTTGSPDKEQADELDSETAFYDACSALEEQVKTFELNSFKPAE